ncbi:MAG: hypothetical protein RMI83_00840 [Desulfurococcaceae archaeon]|nr:hypothetical protein [Sulfolobales archaeon]MDW8169639.1 hypothetical protein [Desulfurococcaceae archaeon]
MLTTVLLIIWIMMGAVDIDFSFSTRSLITGSSRAAYLLLMNTKPSLKQVCISDLKP